MLAKITLTAVVIALLGTATASAVTVTKSIEISAAPAEVWAASARDFCGISQFHPAVEKCELSNGGKTRVLWLKGGGTLLEQQTGITASKRYSYEIITSPLPVADYKSTFSVEGNGKNSTVTWTGSFMAKGASDAEAEKAIDEIYSSGLEALKAKF